MNSRSLSLGVGYTLSSTSRSSLCSDHRSSRHSKNLHHHPRFRYRVTCVMKLTSFVTHDSGKEGYNISSIGRAIREKKKLGNLYRTSQMPRLLSTTSIMPIRTLHAPRTLGTSSSYPLPSMSLCPATPPNRCLTGQREGFPENRLGFIAPQRSLMSSFIFDPST